MRIAASGYSADSIISALHAPTRSISFRYELLGRDLRYKRDVDTISSASISLNSEDTIARTARFEMKDAPIDYLSCRIRPIFRLCMPDGGLAEWPLGVFVLATPERISTGKRIDREIEAYDLTQVLKDDSLATRKFFRAGTFYTDAVRSLIADAGYGVMNIPHSNSAMEAAVEYPVGRERLEIINELLGAINYLPLHADEFGIFTSRPNVQPQIQDVEYAYSDKKDSIIKDGARENVDYFSVPNRFIAYTSTLDSEGLISVFQNDDPMSPLSTANRHVVTERRELNDIANQFALDEYVRNWAREAEATINQVQFSTALMPFHGYLNVYQFEHSKLRINAYYQELSWHMELMAGGAMEHVARRV